MAESTIYIIKIRERIGEEWARSFDGFTITHDAEGHTLISGPVLDQAALHGVIKKVQILGMTLLSIQENSKEDS